MTSRRRKVSAASVIFALLPQPAVAHGILKGVGDFYAGLLHPFVVPAEALAIVALALLLGVSGRPACRLGLPALALGLVIGLAAAQFVAAERVSTTLLLAVALAAAATVTAGFRAPPPVAVGLASLCGIAVGLDARPEPQTSFAVLAASAATIVGGVTMATIISALVLERDKLWQSVATRIAGSWITASAILYFAWRLTTPSA